MLRDISNAAASDSTAGATTKTFTRRRKAPKGSCTEDDTQEAPLSPVSQGGSTTPLSTYSLNDSPCCFTIQNSALLPRSTCQSAGLRRGRRSSLLHAAAVPGHQLCREAPASRSLLLHRMSKARQRALRLYTEHMAQYYAEVDEFELIEESPDAPQTKTKKRTNPQKLQGIPLQTPALPFTCVSSPTNKHSADAACKQGPSSHGLTTAGLVSKSPELLTGLRVGYRSSLLAAADDDEGNQEQTHMPERTSVAATAGPGTASSCADTADKQHQQQRQQVCSSAAQAPHVLQQHRDDAGSLVACTPAGPRINRCDLAAELPASVTGEHSRTAAGDPQQISSSSVAAAELLLVELSDTPATQLSVSPPTQLKSSRSSLAADTPLQLPDIAATSSPSNSAAQRTSSRSTVSSQVGNSSSSSSKILAADTPLLMRQPETPAGGLSGSTAAQPSSSSFPAGSPGNCNSHHSLAADTPLLMQLPDATAPSPSRTAGEQLTGLMASATPATVLSNDAAGRAAAQATADEVADLLEQLDVSAGGSSRQQTASAVRGFEQQKQKQHHEISCSRDDVLQLQQHLQQWDLVAATPTEQPAERKARGQGKAKPTKQQVEQMQPQRKQSARQAAKQQQQQQQMAQEQQLQKLYQREPSAVQQTSKQQGQQQAREAFCAAVQQQQDQTLQRLLLEQQAQLQQQMAHQLQQLDEQQLQDLMQQMEQQLSLNAAQQLAEVEVAAAAQAALTPLQQMLQACGQSMLMDDIPNIADFVASVSASAEVVKLGEGTYGEAFKSGDVVFKFVPIEGSNLINGWPQKGAADLLGEAVIALTLSELSQKTDAAGTLHPSHTDAFVKTHRVGVCRGPYPKSFIKAWHAWDKKHNAENDPIDTFPATQLYAVFAMANCGKDLEGYTLLGYDQARSMMLQVAVALAVAEDCLAFEHRDLHWGNIMLTATPQHGSIAARLRGSTLQIATHGAAVRLIDFTASRLQTPAGDVAFCDLELEDGIFDGPKGKPQFETYRRMRKLTNKDWSGSFLGTNVLWMLYITELLLSAEKPIPGATAGQKRQLREFKKRLAGYSCCGEVIWDELFCGLISAVG